MEKRKRKQHIKNEKTINTVLCGVNVKILKILKHGILNTHAYNTWNSLKRKYYLISSIVTHHIYIFDKCFPFKHVEVLI